MSFSHNEQQFTHTLFVCCKTQFNICLIVFIIVVIIIEIMISSSSRGKASFQCLNIITQLHKTYTVYFLPTVSSGLRDM